MSKKIVVCRDLGSNVMPLLLEGTDIEVVVWPEDRSVDRNWLLQNIAGAVGVLVMLSDKVNSELLDAAGPSLQVVSTMSVGYEHVDLDEISRRGIRLGYTPDVLTDAVADLSVMLALMASRNARETMMFVDKGQWPRFNWSPFAFCGPQLSASLSAPNKTVGFIGFGRIAQATLTRMVAFGVSQCLYCSSPSSTSNISRDTQLAEKYKLSSVRRVEMDELARCSDIIFVLAPGGDNTRHIVNEGFLKKMKKTGVLVNTSRGSVVDSEALALALREKWIWAAGVDVVEGEPDVPANHPLVAEPRCVVLPHIGSATLETRVDMATLAAKNLLAGVFGEPMPSQLQLLDKSA